MNIGLPKLVGASLFFLLIFLTGFWLSRTGKPYGALLFNLHKLIALAALIFLVVIHTQAHKGTPLTGLEWGVTILTLVCFVAAIVSGGLLNLKPPLPAALVVMHRVLPFLIFLGTAISLYLTSPAGAALLH